MNIFDIILTPFIFLIKNVFLFSHSITNNYGYSILLLSFFISLILLPIFILIEKAKKKDDKVKLKMKPLVDEIKRCYKGQERYYYLKTLNRQFDYSPLRALIPVLSLLLQIPFFIAAYQFLDGFKPLEGVSFLFISDLSLPDGVLGPINILPIIMTVVNLVAAYYYTRNGDGSERKQMLIVAGIFLVLLFKLPSGLVLYWTMNNVFSFLRLFITNPEVFKRANSSSNVVKNSSFVNQFKINIVRLRPFYIILTLIAIVSQFNWAFQFNFDDIFFRLVLAVLGSFLIALLLAFIIPILKKAYHYVMSKFNLAPSLYFSGIFMSLYFYFAGTEYFESINNQLILTGLVFILVVQFISLVYFYRRIIQIKSFWNIILVFILGAILTLQFLFLFAELSDKAIAFSFLNIDIVEVEATIINLYKFSLLFVLIASPSYLSQTSIKNSKDIYLKPYVYILSALYITGYIFVWNPLVVFSTFPESFDFLGIEIIKNNLSLHVGSFILLLLIYLICPKKLRWLASVFLLVLVIIGFIHNTLNPINVGVINETNYEDADNLKLSFLYYLLESVSIIAIFYAIYWLAKKSKMRYVVYALILLNILMVSEAMYEVLNTGKFSSKVGKFLDKNNSISFSKTENNIVYIIADAMQGCGLSKMLKDDPDLAKELSGFTWYPNTLAVSRVTNTTMAAILGGHDYDPYSLHKDSTRTNGEKISDAKRALAQKVRDHNLNFTSTHVMYCDIEEDYYDSYLPKWHKDWDVFSNKLKIGNSNESGYSFLWNNALFFSCPYFIKPFIYNDGKWFEEYESDKSKNNSITMKHNFLRLLPLISNTKSKKGNFVLLYSLVTHIPWQLVNDNGDLERDVSPYKNNQWTLYTIKKWMQWMKDNGVYDNTKIIIASDHGAHHNHWKGKVEMEFPFVNIDDDVIPLKRLINSNSMLMVKDYNRKEPLKTDWRMMSNMDINSILFDEIDLDDPDLFKKRTLPTYISWWSKDMKDRYKFNLQTKYEVKNNLFDGNNWKIVEYE